MLRYHHEPTIPGITGYGTWAPFSFDHQGARQHGVQLEPRQAPWRELFTALDALPTPDRAVTPGEEAAAIILACWRYGSYVHVLTEGEPYPPFRSNPGLSRLGDMEMMRIQLEFTSGLAQWLRDRERDPDLIRRRVLAALAVLPGVTQTLPDPAAGPGLPAFYTEHWHTLTRRWQAWSGTPPPPPTPAEGPRAEANFLVQSFYRNDSPLENLHAGQWNQGTELPGYKRLYAAELLALARPLARRLAMHLAARPDLELENIRAIMHWHTRRWSLIQETSPISFLGLPGYGPLGGRLDALAGKRPLIYGRRGAGTSALPWPGARYEP